MERNGKRQRTNEDEAPPLFGSASFAPFGCDDDDEYNAFVNMFPGGRRNDNEQSFELVPFPINFHDVEPAKNELLPQSHVTFASPPTSSPRRPRVSETHDNFPQTFKAPRKDAPHGRCFPLEDVNCEDEPKQRPAQYDHHANSNHLPQSPVPQHVMTEQEAVVKQIPMDVSNYRDVFKEWLEDHNNGLVGFLEELQELRDVNNDYMRAFTDKARQLNEIYQSMKNEKMQILQTLDKIRATFNFCDDSSPSTDP